MTRAIEDKTRGDTRSGVGRQPGRDDPDGGQQAGVGGREEGLNDDALAEQVEGVPQEGLDQERDDLEREANADHDASGDDPRR